MTPVLFGAASVAVTPDFPVPLGGFGQRLTPSEGVHDPIEVTAFCMGDHAPMALVSADLIAIPAPLRQRALTALADARWLSPDRLTLVATHSHSAPVPIDDGDAAAARFTDRLVAGIAEAVQAAYTARRPARLISQTGDVRLGFNRWRPDDADAVDTRIPVVIAVDAESGTPCAVLFGAGCHPTTFGWDNMRISADYPGVARRQILEQLPHVVPMFINTTEGDVVPSTSARRDALDPRGYQGQAADAAQTVGGALAREVLRVIASVPAAAAAGAPGRVDVRTTLVDARPNVPTLDDDAQAMRLNAATARLSACLGADFATRVGAGRLWAAASAAVIAADLDEPDMRDLMIACCHFIGLSGRAGRGPSRSTVAVSVQVLMLDQARFIVLPGEVLVAVGARWQTLAGGDQAFVVACGNAHHRYLPLAAHFAEAGADRRYETVTAGLAPGEVERLLDAGASLLTDLERDALAT